MTAAVLIHLTAQLPVDANILIPEFEWDYILVKNALTDSQNILCSLISHMQSYYNAMTNEVPTLLVVLVLFSPTFLPGRVSDLTPENALYY